MERKENILKEIRNLELVFTEIVNEMFASGEKSE